MNTLLNKINKKKKLFISAIILVLFFTVITLLLCTFNIYATNNDKTEISVDNSNQIDNQIENSILTVCIPAQNDNGDTANGEDCEDQTKLEEETQSNENKSNALTDKKENTNKNSNNKIYTAQNGEKYSIIGNLSIPSLGINYSILSSSSNELLKISLTRYWGAYPNEVGNMVILGHNYKNNKFFGNLPKIKIGDIVKITDNNNQSLDYTVYDTKIIDPNDNSCTSQLTDGHIDVTLITCYYENGNSHATKRFVAKARAS